MPLTKKKLTLKLNVSSNKSKAKANVKSKGFGGFDSDSDVDTTNEDDGEKGGKKMRFSIDDDDNDSSMKVDDKTTSSASETIDSLDIYDNLLTHQTSSSSTSASLDSIMTSLQTGGTQQHSINSATNDSNNANNAINTNSTYNKTLRPSFSLSSKSNSTSNSTPSINKNGKRSRGNSINNIANGTAITAEELSLLYGCADTNNGTHTNGTKSNANPKTKTNGSGSGSAAFEDDDMVLSSYGKYNSADWESEVESIKGDDDDNDNDDDNAEDAERESFIKALMLQQTQDEDDDTSNTSNANPSSSSTSSSSSSKAQAKPYIHIPDTTIALASLRNTQTFKLAEISRLASEASTSRLAADNVDIGRIYNSDASGSILEEAEILKEQYMNRGVDALEVLKDLNKKKELKVTVHGDIDYIEVRKNLYIVHPDVHALSKDKEAVSSIRNRHGVKVRGANVPSMVSTFAQSGISDRILSLLNKLEISEPFAIQKQCLPCIMSGRDVIGIAKTGSGKTLAFVLPMFRHILDQTTLQVGESGPIALVLCPSRELAIQIHAVTKQFVKTLNLKSTCIYGGTNVSEQIGDIKRGTEIIVATPGRLIDILTMQNGRVLSLKRCSFVVMDEADRMFDMGFAPQIKSILSAIRPDRQICLFSATFPKTVEALARKTLKFPIEVVVGGRSVASDSIDQYAEVITDSDKFTRLLQLLGEWIERGKVIVFTDTQVRADKVYEMLTRSGYLSLSLHGGKEQEERDETLSDFRDPISTYRVLVATSVAGRGLDVPSCRLVINYNTPNHLEDYVHRVGRTGRAGKKGTSYTFVNDDDEAKFAEGIVRAMTEGGHAKNVSAELTALAESFKVKVDAGESKAAGGGFGGRGFSYNASEKSAAQMLKSAERRLALIEAGVLNESDDEGMDGENDYDSDNEENDGNGGSRNGGPEEEKKLTTKEIAENSRVKAKAEKDANVIKSSMSNSLVMLPGMAEMIAKTVSGSSEGSSSSSSSSTNINSNSISSAADLKNQQNNAKGLVGSSTLRGQQVNHHYDEVPINDWPREARWKVTQRATITRLNEAYSCAITNKGEYYDPKSTRVPDVGKGEKKMCLGVEAHDANMLKGCVNEIKRLLNEEAMRVANAIGGRYKVV